jgi:hypothetical protein
LEDGQTHGFSLSLSLYFFSQCHATFWLKASAKVYSMVARNLGKWPMAMARPMPRLEPVTKAIFPSPLFFPRRSRVDWEASA